nr:hypothetical protein [Desulfosporosinus youngiae]
MSLDSPICESVCVYTDLSESVSQTLNIKWAGISILCISLIACYHEQQSGKYSREGKPVYDSLDDGHVKSLYRDGLELISEGRG